MSSGATVCVAVVSSSRPRCFTGFKSIKLIKKTTWLEPFTLKNTPVGWKRIYIYIYLQSFWSKSDLIWVRKRVVLLLLYRTTRGRYGCFSELKCSIPLNSRWDSSGGFLPLQENQRKKPVNTSYRVSGEQEVDRGAEDSLWGHLRRHGCTISSPVGYSRLQLKGMSAVLELFSLEIKAKIQTTGVSIRSVASVKKKYLLNFDLKLQLK